MIVIIKDVLTDDECDEIAEQMAAMRFRPGTRTAGWHARLVKDNEQADRMQSQSQSQSYAWICRTVARGSAAHRVAPVTRGERICAVGWAQSKVRDPAQREMLYELDTARRALFDREGKTREFDLISKSHANLMRMWADG